MKLFFLSSLVLSASAFLSPSSRRISSTAVFSTTEADVDIDASVDVAKEELMQLSRDYKDQYGVILIDTKAKESFRKAVEKLESIAEASTDSSLLVGDWNLVCSSASSGAVASKIAIDTSKIPFFNEGPVKDIRNTLNDSIDVVQRIKFGEMSNSIDSIDHVIDYSPPNQLSSFLKNIPDSIKNLDINPLKVSDTKVVLKHKAEVEGTIPIIKTKLSLESVVVNVAGESKNLDPKGADILGINIPFGEYLNAGSFDTTYVDDSMRISRSKVGPLDQIRVFVKASSSNSDSDADAEAVAASVVEEYDDDLDDDEIVEDDDDDEVVESAVDAEVVEEVGDNRDDDDLAPSDIEN
mmetsp:Transcript_3064/g.6602  ORF Transcript_3064/g.6602 Transcript_3064/m.6602 type:complete len:352 (-) Transcript_3064:182-1237(-)|eukprot:CAMPEP_0168178628 /NCGR_PEP_ID=MMETSP0139_2-20121125/9276_1 /TAXON_ID=44445 /ORGANISM="Pseudo-nitzschia australis, Strain 10249 10 AB" /LENGTH=351 /DNA_ID=CAMNT_0008098133 /DNA_START=152 /DNA_END=1207 /DNA_ORIENTATION=-